MKTCEHARRELLAFITSELKYQRKLVAIRRIRSVIRRAHAFVGGDPAALQTER